MYFVLLIIAIVDNVCLSQSISSPFGSTIQNLLCNKDDWNTITGDWIYDEDYCTLSLTNSTLDPKTIGKLWFGSWDGDTPNSNYIINTDNYIVELKLGLNWDDASTNTNWRTTGVMFNTMNITSSKGNQNADHLAALAYLSYHFLFAQYRTEDGYNNIKWINGEKIIVQTNDTEPWIRNYTLQVHCTNGGNFSFYMNDGRVASTNFNYWNIFNEAVEGINYPFINDGTLGLRTGGLNTIFYSLTFTDLDYVEKPTCKNDWIWCGEC